MEIQNRLNKKSKNGSDEAAVIVLAQQFISYKDQLQRMLQYIEETGMKAEFRDIVKEAKYCLMLMGNPNFLREIGVNAIRSFIDSIQDMDRVITIPQNWVPSEQNSICNEGGIPSNSDVEDRESASFRKSESSSNSDEIPHVGPSQNAQGGQNQTPIPSNASTQQQHLAPDQRFTSFMDKLQKMLQFFTGSGKKSKFQEIMKNAKYCLRLVANPTFLMELGSDLIRGMIGYIHQMNREVLSILPVPNVPICTNMPYFEDNSSDDQGIPSNYGVKEKSESSSSYPGATVQTQTAQGTQNPTALPPNMSTQQPQMPHSIFDPTSFPRKMFQSGLPLMAQPCENQFDPPKKVQPKFGTLPYFLPCPMPPHPPKGPSRSSTRSIQTARSSLCQNIEGAEKKEEEKTHNKMETIHHPQAASGIDKQIHKIPPLQNLMKTHTQIETGTHNVDAIENDTNVSDNHEIEIIPAGPTGSEPDVTANQEESENLDGNEIQNNIAANVEKNLEELGTTAIGESGNGDSNFITTETTSSAICSTSTSGIIELPSTSRELVSTSTQNDKIPTKKRQRSRKASNETVPLRFSFRETYQRRKHEQKIQSEKFSLEMKKQKSANKAEEALKNAEKKEKMRQKGLEMFTSKTGSIISGVNDIAIRSNLGKIKVESDFHLPQIKQESTEPSFFDFNFGIPNDVENEAADGNEKEMQAEPAPGNREPDQDEADFQDRVEEEESEIVILNANKCHKNA